MSVQGFYEKNLWNSKVFKGSIFSDLYNNFEEEKPDINEEILITALYSNWLHLWGKYFRIWPFGAMFVYFWPLCAIFGNIWTKLVMVICIFFTIIIWLLKLKSFTELTFELQRKKKEFCSDLWKSPKCDSLWQPSKIQRQNLNICPGLP